MVSRVGERKYTIDKSQLKWYPHDRSEKNELGVLNMTKTAILAM